jgi:hypothetical protein
VSLQPVSDELGRVGTEARSLTSALQAATRDAQELDLVLRARLDEEHQRKQRADSVAMTSPTSVPVMAPPPNAPSIR